MHIRSLTYFRALAILFIVGGHFMREVDFMHPRLDILLWRNFVEGGTTFFVFISGFLFHRVFAPRFDYTRFMRGKLRNVLLPYVILSVPAIAIFFTLTPHAWEAFFGAPRGEGLWAGHLRPILQLLITGRHAIAYWYVPFAILLFLCAPLHMRFIRLGLRWQIAITATLLLAALLLQKPSLDLNKLHALAYYTPVYLIGIMTSLHWEQMRPLLARRWPLLFGIVIALVLAAALDGSYGNYIRRAHTPLLALDLMMAQKIVLTFAILGLLTRLERYNLPALNEIAERSFGIFFLHPILIVLLATSGVLPDLGWDWANYLLWFAAVFGGSYVIAGGARSVLGPRSRLILGC